MRASSAIASPSDCRGRLFPTKVSVSAAGPQLPFEFASSPHRQAFAAVLARPRWSFELDLVEDEVSDVLRPAGGQRYQYRSRYGVSSP
jgi:hypothetical protein